MFVGETPNAHHKNHGFPMAASTAGGRASHATISAVRACALALAADALATCALTCCSENVDVSQSEPVSS